MKVNTSLFVIGASLLIAACTTSNANNRQKEAVKTYPVVPLIQKDTLLQMKYVADIQARKNVELHARVSGILDKIYVDEGQYVKEGQLLFSINDEELRIDLNKASAFYNSAIADARVAEVEVQRVRTLVEKNIVSETELELMQAKHLALLAKVEEAHSAVANARRLLSYTQVHSPFDGIIDRLPLKEGSLLSNGSLLTTISDIQSVYAYFNISEREYLRLMQPNDDTLPNEVRLVLADGSIYAYAGTIEPAESEIDENTGSIAFRASFPNPDGLLKHGASGTLLLDRPVEKALLVPQKSVFEIQDKNYVYVLGNDNTVKMTNFAPGERLAEYYIVRSGLEPSDKIVYEGIQTLRDGELINPVEPAP